MKLTETKNGTIIEVFVKPNQSKFHINMSGDKILVSCTEEPFKGKVNRELLKELSKIFHAKIEIISGFASKRKYLLIRDKSEDVALVLYARGLKNKNMKFQGG